MAVDASENSVELWHEKLKALSPECSPREWAEALHRLGDAYQERRLRAGPDRPHPRGNAPRVG